MTEKKTKVKTPDCTDCSCNEPEVIAGDHDEVVLEVPLDKIEVIDLTKKK